MAVYIHLAIHVHVSLPCVCHPVCIQKKDRRGTEILTRSNGEPFSHHFPLTSLILNNYRFFLLLQQFVSNEAKQRFRLRCHKGVSGMEGGTVFHPEYFLPLFLFGDNRNQGDALLMGGRVYLSAQTLLYETLLAREGLLLYLARIFPVSVCFDVYLTFSNAELVDEHILHRWLNLLPLKK